MPTDPDAPTSFTVEYNSDTEADLSWTAPSDDGNCPLTGYNIIYTDPDTRTDVTVESDYDGTTYTLTGLTLGKTYTIFIQAVNEMGYSSTDTTDNYFHHREPDTPDAPVISKVTDVDLADDYIEITITYPTNDGGDTVTGFNIYLLADRGTYSVDTDLCADSPVTDGTDFTC